ncbi:MAG: hypothetical protein NVSMB23_11060 [Myxococcales bacterium]
MATVYLPPARPAAPARPRDPLEWPPTFRPGAPLPRTFASPGLLVLLLAAGAAAGQTPPAARPSDRAAAAPASSAGPATVEDLWALFAEWRAFQKPRIVDGVPDYTPAAMEAQRRALAGYRRRLAALDPRAWPVAQQVDFHVVRAEMNGLDFDHRVLQPWARNPAFYVTVVEDESDQPAREGPFALGTVELWRYRFPLAPPQAADLAARLATLPALLQQARGNLTGDGRDLWRHGIHSVEEQRSVLAGLARKADHDPALFAVVQRALEATEGFLGWLAERAPSKKGPSGVGVANYDWYLANVQLLPYTWADEVALAQRELARARASLAVEEQRNRKLPPLALVASPEEYDRRFGAAVTEYMAFLAQREILTVRPDMDPALRARVGKFTAARPLEFFAEVDYRDPVLMRTHGYHWFDLARLEHDPQQSPVRRGALLYNIFDTRTEGFATAMEELMMQAGLCDARPRSRELIYILLAQRAARALGDLRMHANQLTLEQAAQFAAANTPRGWLRMSGRTVRTEQHLYLQQPGYGTSYVLGKLEIDQLLATRAAQLGDAFTLRGFIDELDAAGLLPVSLLRWQLTFDAGGVPGVGWPGPPGPR